MFTFTLTQPLNVTIIGGPTNGDNSETNNIFMGVAVQAGNRGKSLIYFSNNELFNDVSLAFIECNLSPGTYYIFISTSSDNTFPYYFKILY